MRPQISVYLVENCQLSLGMSQMESAPEAAFYYRQLFKLRLSLRHILVKIQCRQSQSQLSKKTEPCLTQRYLNYAIFFKPEPNKSRVLGVGFRSINFPKRHPSTKPLLLMIVSDILIVIKTHFDTKNKFSLNQIALLLSDLYIFVFY